MPFSGLIICQNNSQNSGKHFTYSSWLVLEDTRQEQPRGGDAEARRGGRGHTASLLFPGAPFPHTHVSSSSDARGTLPFRGFIDA